MPKKGLAGFGNSTYIPEDEVYLRVNKDNIASLKVILHNGGYVKSEDALKYYVRIKNKQVKIGATRNAPIIYSSSFDSTERYIQFIPSAFG